MSHENQQSQPEIAPNFYSIILPATDSIIRALVAKNSEGEVRIDNFVPYTTPGGISVERRSTGEVILPKAMYARTINDQVNICGLNNIASPFDVLQISRIQEEYRSDDDEVKKLEWLCSYITLLEHDGKATRAEVQFDANAGPALHITADEGADFLKISADIITALRAAQHVATYGLAPSMNQEKISLHHEVLMPPRDPHLREIGSVALASNHRTNANNRRSR